MVGIFFKGIRSGWNLICVRVSKGELMEFFYLCNSCCNARRICLPECNCFKMPNEDRSDYCVGVERSASEMSKCPS